VAINNCVLKLSGVSIRLSNNPPLLFLACSYYMHAEKLIKIQFLLVHM